MRDRGGSPTVLGIIFQGLSEVQKHGSISPIICLGSRLKPEAEVLHIPLFIKLKNLEDGFLSFQSIWRHHPFEYICHLVIDTVGTSGSPSVSHALAPNVSNSCRC